MVLRLMGPESARKGGHQLLAASLHRDLRGSPPSRNHLRIVDNKCPGPSRDQMTEGQEFIENPCVTHHSRRDLAASLAILYRFEPSCKLTVSQRS